VTARRVGILDMDGRVLHAVGDVHAVTACGRVMRLLWVCGPIDALAERADAWCAECFVDAPPL
jgi:hypothetical protein